MITQGKDSRLVEKSLFLAFLFFTQPCLQAQAQHDWEEAFYQLTTNEDNETGAWDEIYETLCDIQDQPLDLNTASDEDFASIPFLTARQIEDICEYRYRHKYFASIDELMLIGSLDYYRRQLLRYFVYASAAYDKTIFPSFANIMKYGKQDETAYAKIPTYERKGDENGYYGYPYKHWLRYNYTYGTFVKAGIVAAQDAGEPFFKYGNSSGYDYYSAYLVLRDWGRLQTLALGRYKLSIGMGLVVNSSYSLGKLSVLSSLGRNVNTIRAHSSVSESGYFQGAAAKVKIGKHLSATAFASYRPYDATLNDDGTVATLTTNGYHRTKSELQKKHNTNALAAGTNISYTKNRLHLGATAVYTHYDRDLSPNTSTLYKKYYAKGNDFVNISADYGYYFRKFSLHGETAVNKDGAIATINTANISIGSTLDLMILQRFYSYKYTSPYANSFSEGSRVQNESGIYAGMEWKPRWGITIMAFSDFSYSPWAKYGISASSYASDNMITFNYAMRHWTIGARYRFHYKQGDDEEKKFLIGNIKQSGRITLGFDGNRHFTSQTQIDMALTQYKEKGHGYMLSQNLGYKIKNIQLTASLKYFDTSNYESRIYGYERGPLYSFSYSSFYGQGIRYALMVKARYKDFLTLTAKVGTTNYLDRPTIGSGYQTVNASSVTDIELQTRVKF